MRFLYGGVVCIVSTSFHSILIEQNVRQLGSKLEPAWGMPISSATLGGFLLPTHIAIFRLDQV